MIDLLTTHYLFLIHFCVGVDIVLTFDEALMNRLIFINWSSIQLLYDIAMPCRVLQLILIVNYFIAHKHFFNGLVFIGYIQKQFGRLFN